LEDGDAEGIYRYSIAPFLDEFVSRPFEGVCREYLRFLNQNNKLPFHFNRIGRYWTKTAELDIMAKGQANDEVILGECKYRRSAFDTSDMEQATAKCPPGYGHVYWYFFSRSGFTRAVQERAALKPNVRLVGINNILEGL
jgi:hypothetical protein